MGMLTFVSGLWAGPTFFCQMQGGLGVIGQKDIH